MNNIKTIEVEKTKIELLINFENINLNRKLENQIIFLNPDELLEKRIKRLLKLKNIKIDGEYYLYLKRNGKIVKSIGKEQTILELELNSKDEILLSSVKLEINQEINKELKGKNIETERMEILLNVNPKIKKRRNIHNNLKSRFSSEKAIKDEKTLIYKIHNKEEGKKSIIKNIILILIIIFSLIIIGLSILCYFIFIKKHSKNNEINNEEFGNGIKYKNENLATKINYNVNYIWRYSNEKIMEVEIESEEIRENNEPQSMNKISDIIFIVREQHLENNDMELTKKKWFTGYLGFLNMTIINGTNDTLIIYDEKLNKYLSNNSNGTGLSQFNEQEKVYFVKIEFYENGELKNIFIPEGFSLPNIDDIKEIIELIIPKISANLFVNNITEFFISPNNFSLNNNFRNLNEKTKLMNNKKLKYTVALNDYKNRNARILSNNSLNESFQNKIYVEQYLSAPLTESVNYDLREINNLTDDVNSTKIQNLTRYSKETVENDFAKMEGSSKKSSVFTMINEKGLIESIIQIEETEMNNETDNMDLEKDYMNKQIYNENNQISLENIKDNSSETQQEIKFNISKVKTRNINKINLTDYFINDSLNKKLYNFFDNFKYTLYKENEQNLTNIRMLQIKENFLKSNNLIELDNENNEIEVNNKNKKFRKLVNGDSYYGLKKFINEKDIFNHNLIGLKLKGQLFTEIDPSSGIAQVYSINQFGNIVHKLYFPEIRTNLNIIIERTNQMTYNLIKILNHLNNNLKERNEKYCDIIINYENKIIKLFENYYDYSKLFNENLENLYQNISTFSFNTFNVLIEMISNAYDNYTNILEEVKEGKYDVFNIIRNSIKNDYINYIKNMNDMLEIFCNDTLLFLDKIQKEIDETDDLPIDFFYDIIDVLYDGKMILREFISKLFSSVEKGILTLKQKINNNAEEKIGELLYISDFLSNNINKNELLKKSFEEDIRNELSFKLTEFRNILNYIIDLLISNINSDYINEISDNNENGIKFNTNEMVNKYLNQIENNEKNLTELIEQKIQYLDLYELYNSNLDVINNINNKTIIENIEDSYNNILYKALKIEPEFLNKSNDIVIKKQSLFNITKSIINEINQKNAEIKDYIENYSKEYFENNYYNLHSNLYNFNKSFKNYEINDLLTDFYILINETIKIKLIGIFENNFKLAKAAFDDENKFFDEKSKIFWFKDLYMGSAFIDKFYNYTNITNKLFESVCHLPNLINYYFLKIKSETEKYIRNTINSINSFYFNNKLYKDNFIPYEKIKNKILEISLNDNFFQIQEPFIDKDIYSIINETVNPFYLNISEYISNYFYKISKRTTKGIFKNTQSDFVFRYYIFFFHIDEHDNIKHNDYVDKLERNLSKIEAHISRGIDKIIKKFISKFDNHLTNYIKNYQDLYSYLYKTIGEKINKHEIIKHLTNDYQILFSDIVSNNSNLKLLEKLYNNSLSNISSYFNGIESNINLIQENYFNLYYLKDYNKFFEYPKEIIFKMNQFMKELNGSFKEIKNNINNIFRKQITNIIKSTNKYIEKINENNLKFIEQNIKKNEMLDLYINPRNIYISTLFTNCKNLYISASNNIYKDSTQNNYLKINSNDYILNNDYNSEISLIINNYSNFISYFQEKVNQNFNLEKNNTNENESLIGMNYSKYNFNVAKIRRGLNFTKSLIENIKSTLYNLKFDELLNISFINIYDYITNEKNLFNIYSNTLNELNIINNDNEDNNKKSLQSCIQELESNLKDRYNFKYDILPFIKDFETILKFENKDFLNNASDYNNQTINHIYSLFEEFNNTLYQQLINNSKDTYFNISFEFNKLYNEYYNKIENSFNNYNKKIKNLKNNNNFYNCLRNHLNSLQDKKRNYFKQIINEISKNYNMDLLNLTVNLGENIEKIMKEEYNNEIFNNYDKFIQIFENSDNLINNILSLIVPLKNKIQEKFRNIFNGFNRRLQEEKVKINSLINQNKTSNSNFSLNIYNEFDIECKEKLNTYLKEIIDKIDNSYLDENYIIKYFNEYYHLQNYKIDITDLSNDFKEIEENINLIFSQEDIKYKKFLNDLLLNSFYSSYNNLSNNFLKEQISNNINISINYKIERLIDYITEKIKDEYNYYILLLNNTDELGKTSKIAVKKLYIDFNNKLNDIIDEYLININDFELPSFYKNIEKTFKNNFINYYFNEINEYDIKIYKLNKYFKELILSNSFNNSLNNLSEKIINEVIDKEIKKTINITINSKIKNLKDLLINFNNNITDILNTKVDNTINENITIISNLVNEYDELIKNQDEKFIFEPNDNLTILTDDFFINILGPPLNKIKEEYITIENKILSQIIKIINEFPDFYTIIKDNINISYNIYTLDEIFEEIKNNLLLYGDESNEDFGSIFNKIIHYAYINGLEIYNKSCENSFCSVQSNLNEPGETRYLNEKKEIIFNNYSNINRTEILKKKNKNINFKRKLEYNENMGALSNDDVIFYLLEIEKTLYNFNKTYLGNKFKQMKETLNTYIYTINYTLLAKLKNSIDKTSSKFLTLLTENSYKILEKNIYKQYNDIEIFIHEKCNSTKEILNNFIKHFNNTSIWIKLNFDLIYNRVLNYHKVLHDSIQQSYKIINDDEEKKYKHNLRSLNIIDDFNSFFWKYNSTFKFLQEIFSQMMKYDNKTKEQIDSILNFFHINITEFNDTLIKAIKFINNFQNNPYKFLKDNLNIKRNKTEEIIGFPLGFSFYIPIIKDLSLDVYTYSYLGYGYNFESKFDLEKQQFSAFLGAYIEATINMTANLRVTIPSDLSPIKISFSIGMKGIIASGKLCLDLTFDFYNLLFRVNIYFEIRLLEFQFFISMKISVHLLFINYEDDFSLYKTDISSKKINFKIWSYENSFSNGKNLLQILNIE